MAQIDYIIKTAQSYLGISEGSARHKEILSIYNTHIPLARNYRVSVNDAWCMAFVSAIFIKCNAVAALGKTECGCEEYLSYAKTYGMTVKKDEARRGDIILYDWGRDGRSDHVGIVVSRSGDSLKVIEGNISDTVGYRDIIDIDIKIRAVVRPHYSNKESTRYDASKVSYAESFNREIAGKYKCTASDYLALRYNPFVIDNLITEINPGEVVRNYGYHTGEWLLVEYANYTGFAHRNWLKKI